MKLPKSLLNALAVGTGAALLLTQCSKEKDSITTPTTKTEIQRPIKHQFNDSCPACGMG